MAGAYAREAAAAAYAREANGRSYRGHEAGERGFEGAAHWPPWNGISERHSHSFSDAALGERGRPMSPMRGFGQAEERQLSPLRSEARQHSPMRGHGPAEVSYGSHYDVDRSYGQVPILPKDDRHAQRAFDHVQTELLLQNRRQDDVFESVARVEADLGRVARLAAENEDLHATERQQKHAAMATLTRRTEDALLTCESLRKGQERLVQTIEHLEASAQERERGAPEETQRLQRDVEALHNTVRQKLDAFGHALRRLDAMEQIFDENTKLRQEVAQLRRANERRDLEMAAVQGQIDALTKLVREQLREPLSASMVDA